MVGSQSDIQTSKATVGFLRTGILLSHTVQWK